MDAIERTVSLRPAVALLDHLAKVDFRWLVSDCNVDFALRQGVIGDLVITPARQPLFLQIILRENVVNIAAS